MAEHHWLDTSTWVTGQPHPGLYYSLDAVSWYPAHSGVATRMQPFVTNQSLDVWVPLILPHAVITLSFNP